MPGLVVKPPCGPYSDPMGWRVRKATGGGVTGRSDPVMLPALKPRLQTTETAGHTSPEGRPASHWGASPVSTGGLPPLLVQGVHMSWPLP